MKIAPQHFPAGSIILVWLLMLGQWTGFAMVLCVAGPDHVRVEGAGAHCCAPYTLPAGIYYEDAARSCHDCSDIPLQTGFASGHSFRQNDDGMLAAAFTVSPSELLFLLTAEAVSVTGCSPPTLGLSVPIAPLRC